MAMKLVKKTDEYSIYLRGDKRYAVEDSRKKPVNGSWRMDETYIKLNGKWVYLYRAVDKEGNTIDFLLRAKRDAVAAKAFFRKAFKENGRSDKVTVDKSGSNKAALDYFNKDVPKEEEIEIRQVKYLNNIIEQDHRFIKKRTHLEIYISIRKERRE